MNTNKNLHERNTEKFIAYRRGFRKHSAPTIARNKQLESKRFIPVRKYKDRSLLWDDVVEPQAADWFKTGLDAETLKSFQVFTGVLDDIRKSVDNVPKSMDNGIDYGSELIKLREALEALKPENFSAEAFRGIEKLKHDVAEWKPFQGKGSAKNLLLVVLVLGTGAFAYIKPCSITKTIFALAVGALGVFSDIFTDVSLCSNFMEFVSKVNTIEEDVILDMETVEPQMEDTALESIASLMTTTLAGYVSFTAGKDVPKTLFQSLGSLGRVTTTVTDIFKTLFEVIEKAVNWVRHECMDLPSVRFFDTFSVEIDNYLTDSSAILDLERKSIFHRDPENYERLALMVNVGEKLMRELPRDRKSQAVIDTLRAVVKQLTNLRAIFEASNYSLAGARQEPVGIMLRGGPGVGKSITMEHLNYALSAITLNDSAREAFERNPATFVYNRQFEGKYWDGYTPSKYFTMFDDLGQIKDNTNPDGEFANVLRAYNTFEMNLHMANMAAKGVSTFRSKFIFATTNMTGSYVPESILSKEAFLRRWDYNFVVTPRPEYCTKETRNKGLYERRLDSNKFPITTVSIEERDGTMKEVEVTDMDPSLQHFWMLEKDGVTLCGGRPLEFHEVVSLAFRSFKTKQARYALHTQKFKQTYQMYVQLEDKLNGKCDDDSTSDFTVSAQSGLIGPLFHAPSSIEGSIYSCDEDSNTYEDDLEDSIARALSLAPPRLEVPSLDTVEFLCGGEDVDTIKVLRALIDKTSRMKPLHKQMYSDITSMGSIYFGIHNVLECHSLPVVYYNLFIVMGVKFTDYIFKYQAFESCYVFDVFPMRYPKTKSFGTNLVNACKDKIVQFRAYIKSFLANTPLQMMYDTMCEFKFYILGFCGIISLPFVWRKIVGDKPTTTEESFGFSDRMKSNKTSGKKWVGKSSHQIKEKLAARNGSTVPQGGDALDPGGFNLFNSIVKNAQYQVWAEVHKDRDEFTKPGYAFGIKGTLMLMPLHFIKSMLHCVELDEDYLDAKVKFCKNIDSRRDHQIVVLVSDLLLGYKEGILADNDMVLVDLGNKMQPGRDNTKYFVNRSDYKDNQANFSFAMAFTYGRDKQFFTGYASAEDNKVAVTPKEMDSYYVRRSYKYKAHTSVGDCGAPMCWLNSALPLRKLCGFHVAGNKGTGVGYASVVCVEDLLEDLNMFDNVTTDTTEELSLLKVDPDLIISEGQFEIIGALSKAPSTSGVSKIIKSKLYSGWHIPMMGVAQLNNALDADGNLVEPMKNALKKYCHPIVHVDMEALVKATLSYEAYFYSNTKRSIKERLHTWREAVNGLDTCSFSHGINVSTSAGFPMNVQGNTNYKKWLFEKGREGPIFEERLENVIEKLEIEVFKMQNNIRPNWVFTDCLKDEKRPIAKCISGSTRLFSACPFFYLIIFRKYFGAFQLQFIDDRISNGSAVGINPFSDEWDVLARKLHQFSKDDACIGAGDYAGYDGREQPAIHWVILDIINRWYDDGEVNRNIRRMLWLEVVNSRHVNGNYVMNWYSSLPSGHPFTIVINCMYNHILFRLCWDRLGLPSFDFNKNVYLCVCGDDNIFSVHPDYREYFNELTIVKPMADFGMEYTTELKGTAVSQFRYLDKVEFLKRSFRYEPILGRYVAPLRLDVVLEIPYWTKKVSNRDNITCDNTIETLRELSLHGVVINDAWYPKIVKHFEKNMVGINPTTPLRMSWKDRLLQTVDQDLYLY